MYAKWDVLDVWARYICRWIFRFPSPSPFCFFFFIWNVMIVESHVHVQMELPWKFFNQVTEKEEFLTRESEICEKVNHVFLSFDFHIIGSVAFQFYTITFWYCNHEPFSKFFLIHQRFISRSNLIGILDIQTAIKSTSKLWFKSQFFTFTS